MDEPQIPLWLDCDTGHDDAFALLLAAHHPSLHLLGTSTVHGNASLSRTTSNTRRVLAAIGRADVPVHPGAARPFCRNAVHAADIHGASGLDGTELLPELETGAEAVVRKGAVLVMRDALMEQQEGRAWVVATGALTNVALLFAAFPEVVGQIAGLSVMGGAVGGGFTEAPLGHEGRVEGEGERLGNWTRWAEFNIYCDPEAAASIFSNRKLATKTTLIPLDLTHQVLATREVQQMLLTGTLSSGPSTAATNVNLRQMFHDLLLYFAHTYSEVYGLTDGPPLHDPIAVAVLLEPLMGPSMRFDDHGGERWHVKVVTDGLHSRLDEERGQVGRTMVTESDHGGVRIPRSMDVESFWKLINHSLQAAEKAISAP